MVVLCGSLGAYGVGSARGYMRKKNLVKGHYMAPPIQVYRRGHGGNAILQYIGLHRAHPGAVGFYARWTSTSHTLLAVLNM